MGGQDPICHLRNDPGCNSCSKPIYEYAYNSICCYTVTSPIILDLDGSGFHLTDAAHGVISPILLEYKQLFQISWTAAGANDAWLVLDRNGDGKIDDFSEMFGNLTPQPEPPAGQFKNGFLALAVYDRPEFGGNGDGWITKEDAIYAKLQVWQDKNHDGISQPEELHSLESVGVAGISLDYHLSKKEDDFGNRFTYRSVIRDMNGGEAGKVIYDVFLRASNKLIPYTNP